MGVQKLCTLLLVILGIWLLSTCGSSERILFLLPLSTKSHKILLEPLINALASRNHKITVLTNERSETIHESVIELLPITSDDFMSGYPNPLESRRTGGGMGFPLQFIMGGCHKVIKNETFRKVMSAKMGKQFDLMIVDGFLVHCLDGFIYDSGIPFISVTSMPAPSYISERVGNFLPPSIIPVLSFRDYYEPDGFMNFGQRLKNFVHYILARIYMNFMILPQLENVYKEYLGKNLPGILEIESNVSMIFMNSHHSMNLARPMLPALVEIGGIHCRTANPLDLNLEAFLSKSTSPDGFIYLSMGSLIDLNGIPKETIEVLLESFSKLKQKTVVKWKGLMSGESIITPENVIVADWFPQQDLLGHNNIRLFISHGGLLSMQEAVFHAVPVLGIPFGIDQDTNIHNAVLQGYALKLDIDSLNETILTTSIYSILNNSSFYESAQQISRAFRHRPVSPLETAVFWSEYVAKTMPDTADAFLKSPARRMTMFQYYSCDILMFLLVLISAAVMILKRVFILACHLVINRYSNYKRARNVTIHKKIK